MKFDKVQFFRKLIILFFGLGMIFALFALILSILGYKELVKSWLWIWIICASSTVVSLYFYLKFDADRYKK